MVKEICETMKKLQVFTRAQLENALFPNKYDKVIAEYVDELLCSPIVRQVFELYVFVG